MSLSAVSLGTTQGEKEDAEYLGEKVDYYKVCKVQQEPKGVNYSALESSRDSFKKEQSFGDGTPDGQNSNNYMVNVCIMFSVGDLSIFHFTSLSSHFHDRHKAKINATISHMQKLTRAQ